MRIKILWGALILAFLASTFPLPILALDYPTREIEFIAAFAPGSNTDHFARLAARFGEKHLGKPIVVVNKPGGGGARGFAALASAKPDGYTLGLLSQGVIGQPYLMKGVTINYRKNFRIICQIDYSAQGFYVKKGGPYDVSLPELIKKAKDKPGTIKVGIGGTWTAQDFVRAIFEDETGVKLVRVPFPGAAEAIPAILGGHIDAVIGPASEWTPLYKGSKVSVLGLSADKRDPRVPDIPTFKEIGYDVVLMSAHWVGAPAATPDAIINILAEAFKKGFAEPDFMTAASNLGATGAWESPEDSLKSMDKVDQIYQRVVKKYGLKPN
jgi:tripartite-type tricarboxylate transporter receptor subunit TctC